MRTRQSTGAALLAAAIVPVAVAAGPEQFTKVYWTDPVTETIRRADLDGSDEEQLLQLTNARTGFALDLVAAKMYWTEDAASIRRANLDGSQVEEVISGGFSSLSSIALDQNGGKIYWTQNAPGSSGKIFRANLDGSDMEEVITGLNGAEVIALDPTAGKVYWSQWSGSDNRIRRANLNGLSVEDLVFTVGDVKGLALDLTVQKMYWTEGPYKTISRADLNGSNVEVLLTEADGVGTPFRLVLDVAGGKMYWGEDSVVKWATLDGESLETIIASTAKGLALGPGVVSPTVIGNPASVVVDEFSPVDFSVTVAGSAPFQFQWRRDGIALSDGPLTQGSQSSTLTLIPRLDDVGLYDCVIANDAGVDTSEGAVLGVRVVCRADLDSNLEVGIADFLELLSLWGPCQ